MITITKESSTQNRLYLVVVLVTFIFFFKNKDKEILLEDH